MADSEKRIEASDGIADSLAPDTSEKSYDYKEFNRIADSLVPDTSEKIYDYQGFDSIADSLAPDTSEKIYDYQEFNRIADSLVPDTSEKIYDYQEFDSIADSLAPDTSEKIYDYQEFDSLAPDTSEKIYDYQEFNRIADSLVPDTSEKIYDYQEFDSIADSLAPDTSEKIYDYQEFDSLAPDTSEKIYDYQEFNRIADSLVPDTSEKIYDYQEFDSIADSLAPDTSEKIYDYQEFDSLAPDTSEKIYDYQEFNRIADSLVPDTSEKIYDYQEFDSIADSLAPDTSEKIYDYQEFNRIADSLVPDTSEKIYDYQEFDSIADSLLPETEDYVDFEEYERASNALPVSSDVDEGELVTDSDGSLTLSHDKICNKENRGSQYGLDFWKHIFSVGTTMLNVLHLEHNWNFSNLQDAFEEGGVLHVANNVYLFSSVEDSFRCCHRRKRGRLITMLPVVVAVVSPFPPTRKIGMYSMNGYKKVVEMKRLGMHWDPYIPIKNRSHFHTGSSSWKHEPPIFVLSCADRTTSLERVKRFNRRLLLEDCIPYFDNPLKKQTCVDIRYPSEPEPVVCKFDLEMDDLEEFTNKLIEAEELSEHHKDGFKEYVSVKVREIQRANDEVRLQLSREEVAVAFKNMRFYKFYPVPTSETPVAHQWKMSRTINGYYGGAHGIF